MNEKGLDNKAIAAQQAKAILDSPAVQAFWEVEPERLSRVLETLPLNWSKEVEDAYRAIHFERLILKRFKEHFENQIKEYYQALYLTEEEERREGVDFGV